MNFNIYPPLLMRGAHSLGRNPANYHPGRRIRPQPPSFLRPLPRCVLGYIISTSVMINTGTIIIICDACICIIYRSIYERASSYKSFYEGGTGNAFGTSKKKKKERKKISCLNLFKCTKSRRGSYLMTE